MTVLSIKTKIISRRKLGLELTKRGDKSINKLHGKSLESKYISYIRPLIEYGDTIWDNCTRYEKYELDKVQNEAARIATGATKLVPLTNLYKEICWETLPKKQSNHK